MFTDTRNHSYRPNGPDSASIYLGRDQQLREVGITTERHVMTIAGSGGGKGAALLIPNMQRWDDNAVVIDPKGSIAAATWQRHRAHGRRVAVLDPFDVADVPDELRVSINLLDGIDLQGPAVREDIRAIADGNIIRYKAEDGTWDNGALVVLSGLIAYVLDDPEPAGRTLTAVRQMLVLPPDARQEIFEEMAATERTDALGKMMKAAAAIGLSPTKKNQEFVSGAVDHTEWLDSDAMAGVLQKSDFRMCELKTGNAVLFLVLPPRYIADHARFMRLFVRCALNAAMSSLRGRRTLFILDECYTLGHIDQLAKASGMMREYNLHLWTIWQDLGQLISLYGAEGAHTFFANADAHIFFNLVDGPSLDYVSGRIGMHAADDVPAFEPPDPYEVDRRLDETIIAEDWEYVCTPTDVYPNAIVGGKPIVGPLYDAYRTRFRDEIAKEVGLREARRRAEYEHAKSKVGTPRLPASKIRELVAKKDGDPVARSMIVFGKGGDVFNLPLSPYFVPDPIRSSAGRPALPTPPAAHAAPVQEQKPMPPDQDHSWLFNKRPPKRSWWRKSSG